MITDKDMVKKHLVEHGHITSWDAIQSYGITRLSAVIFVLRKEGYDIETQYKKGIDRFGSPCRYGDYILKGVQE